MKSTSDIGDTSLKDRLKQVIKHFAGTQVHFAEILGISQSTVASWVQRETLSYEAIILILKNCPNLSEQWLISGVGDMLIKKNNYYPTLCVQAGDADFQENVGEATARIDIPGVNADIYFPVIGSSMEPIINEGDIIGVRRIRPLEQIDPAKIYMVITKQGRMVKYIEQDKESETILLLSANKRFKPIRIQNEDIINIYNVVFSGRAL